MASLERLVEKARQSTLFTAPVLGPDLERFLNEQTDPIKRLARQAIDTVAEHIYWIGSGNSWVNLYSGKYLLDRYTNMTSDCMPSYEFVWRTPQRLNHKAWTFLASFSGATEDTVVALRHAKAQKSKTIALVNQAESLMGQEADLTIPYHSKALYLLPLAAVYLFSLEVARLQNHPEAEKIMSGLQALPALLSRQYVEEESRAKALAEQYVDEDMFYLLASGPLYGLGYKFALTVFMENMRVNAGFMHATEFRHGPVEMLERHNPTMVVLKGTDESREGVDRVCKVAEDNGARLIVFDLADYGNIHPMLAPFVLMIPLQWFAVYSSLLRGIEDLDERVVMGRGILGRGKGITWP